MCGKAIGAAWPSLAAPASIFTGDVSTAVSMARQRKVSCHGHEARRQSTEARLGGSGAGAPLDLSVDVTERRVLEVEHAEQQRLEGREDASLAGCQRGSRAALRGPSGRLCSAAQRPLRGAPAPRAVGEQLCCCQAGASYRAAARLRVSHVRSRPCRTEAGSTRQPPARRPTPTAGRRGRSLKACPRRVAPSRSPAGNACLAKMPKGRLSQKTSPQLCRLLVGGVGCGGEGGERTNGPEDRTNKPKLGACPARLLFSPDQHIMG